jgi:HlyD family secretion protein
MKRKRVAAAAAAAGLLATVVWLFAARSGGDDGLVASGTVEATEADLGFQAGGRVRLISVREGETVAAGQELARLDEGELSARHASAVAQLEAARALLAELERGARPEELRQASSAVATVREQLAEAERNLERTRTLEAGGAVSREALERAQTAVEVARAQQQQAEQQAALVHTGPRVERIDAQRAVVRQAEAAVQQMDALLDHAIIRAPFAGVVTVRHRHPGEAVPAGAPVLSVMDPADRWVRIYVRQDRIGEVSLGQAAEIRTDGDPGRSFDGRVTFISAQAEFTPRNVQTTEQRVKLVYAVKVSLSGDAAQVLKPGMPADVVLR